MDHDMCKSCLCTVVPAACDSEKKTITEQHLLQYMLNLFKFFQSAKNIDPSLKSQSEFLIKEVLDSNYVG